MRQLTAALSMTLDGVVEAPGAGDTTLLEKRGWSHRYMTPGELIFSQMESTDAMLLGRKTFEGFAAFWPTMPADDPIAQRMNDTQKFVASTTLREAAWTSSTLYRRARDAPAPGRQPIIQHRAHHPHLPPLPGDPKAQATRNLD